MKNYSAPGDYFEHVIQKHETFDDNPSIQIYINKIDIQEFCIHLFQMSEIRDFTNKFDIFKGI